ncbi:MAG TPA: ATP synthase F1 subunit epsilon [Clostridiales bacterium]|jgi:F-type H+-transporting ATPase subunit epsilon|nr:ATP synthase F1 subunit epsilon [Clostridiales bacterium]
MANTLQLEVITPSKLFYRGEVELVIVRTTEGDEGFMANHSWGVKLLAAGELWFKEAETKKFRVASLAGGFIDVKENIIIFTDAAEWPEEIDVERAKEERRKAEEWLKFPSEDDIEIELARTAIRKSTVRMNVKEGGLKQRQ